jgi:type II secretory pathway component PulC
MAHADAPLTGCVDAQKHQLRVRQLSADRWSIVKEVLPLLRSERKSSITKQLDQTTGQQIGYTIVDVGDGSCLQALGFRNGDLVRSLNGHNLTDWGAAMQSFAAITKDGAAIVRLERGGKAMTVVYEIQN